MAQQPMRSSAGLMAAAMMMFAGGNQKRMRKMSDEDLEQMIEQEKTRIYNAQRHTRMSNGLMEFTIGDKTVWALNEENARRKALGIKTKKKTIPKREYIYRRGETPIIKVI